MSRGLGYIRKFIIFKKDYSNMYGYNPRGHGKLEIKGLKGNITINIENAEPDNFYNIAFVDQRNAELIGKIYTEESGKGKADIIYNLNDLEAKGFSADEINGILIFRDANILLGGYISKEDNSIEEFIERLPTEVVQAIVEEKPPVEEVSVEKFEAVVEETTTEEQVVEGELAEELVEEVAEVFAPEEPEILPPVELEMEEYQPEEYVPEEYMVPAVESISEEELPPIMDEFESEEAQIEEPLITHTPAVESIPEEVITSETVVQMTSSTTYGYDNIEVNRKVAQKNQTTDYILSILRYFPYIEPFKLDLHGYNWWKIGYEDYEDPRGFLPYFSLLIGGDQKYNRVNDNNVTAKDLLIAYEHYIFGLYNVNDEVKFYVYGVPGTFSKEEHPHKGTTGFNTWFEGKDVDGYWLLYIDPLHGKVIYPANPMIPNN